MISQFGQAILGGALVFLGSSVCFSILYSIFRKTILKTSSISKASFTLWYAALAAFVSVISALLLHFPNLSYPIVFQHCHSGMCSPHLPETVYPSFLGLAIMASVVCGIFLFGILVVRSITFASRKLRVLTKLASEKRQLGAGTNYHIVESNDVFAWCTGLINPRIFVSRGMIDQTSQNQLNVILAHEHCHLTKRDNLRKLLLNWTTILWLPWQKEQIKRDFATWIEQYSNLYASQQIQTSSGTPVKANSKQLSAQGWDSLQILFLTILFVFAVSVMTSLSHFLIELLN